MSGASPTERQPYLLTYYLKSVQASDGQFNNLVRGSLLMDKFRLIDPFKILLGKGKGHPITGHEGPRGGVEV
jgi:hypothetical protein